MNKLKKIWQNILPRMSRKLFVVSGSLFLLLLIAGAYYGAALARVSEAEIGLAALREEIAQEKICHEDCLAVRKKQEETIIAALKKPEENLLKRMEAYFSNPAESREFKEEIINLWRLDDDSNAVPQYLYEYLDNEAGDLKLQALIISSLLSKDNDKRWVDYYFDLLASERDVSLKKEALAALSNRADKAGEFNLKQLALLKNLLLGSKTPPQIKADLALLIGEYYPFFPKDADSILQAAYNGKEIDNITRAYAADILNRYAKEEKFPLPKISGAEWETYYNY